MRSAFFVLTAFALGCGGASGQLVDTSPSVCASGKVWQGTGASPQMRPGHACVACHTVERGPTFTAAGTVYGAANEVNDCGGESMGLTLELTGADGKVLVLTPNAAGNFYYQGALALPYRARVLRGNEARPMAAAQSNGDCNACHTATGLEGAPGRIAF